MSADPSRPLVSLIVPAYNEAPIVEQHLGAIRRYLESLEGDYRWELIFIDDGSADATGRIAEAFAAETPMQVLRHERNLGLGRALRSGFAHSQGDYLVTLDLDLSYSLDHVGRLLTKMREARAALVLASPYAKGGRVANVPWARRAMSRWANRLLSLSVRGRLATLTGMVRAYDGPFARGLELESAGAEINLEVILRALQAGARIEEIPARLDWGGQKAERARRGPGRKALAQTLTVLSFGRLFLKHSRR